MESLLGIRGKVALITGSSRGIGWAIARAFASHGAIVLLNGTSNAEVVQQRAEEISRDFGVQSEGYVFDVGDAKGVGDVYASIFKRHKRLDILVNNAGVLQDNLLGMIRPDEYERVFHANVRGVLLNTQYASRLMVRNRGGAIVNLSSIIGRVGNVGQTVYGASKAAVIGLTLSAAKELAPMNVRVNAIAPGLIDTAMTRGLPAAKFQERLMSVKMGRIGTPEEVAKAALFLASEMSSYVTGQVLGVDGGMLI